MPQIQYKLGFFLAFFALDCCYVVACKTSMIRNLVTLSAIYNVTPTSLLSKFTWQMRKHCGCMVLPLSGAREAAQTDIVKKLRCQTKEPVERYKPTTFQIR
jgi:hypothetical protein